MEHRDQFDLPSVTVVIPNRDGLEHLRRCIESVRSLDYPGGLLEVVVVDNGSSDGSIEWLRGIDGVRLVEVGRNLGFAAAINRGVASADSECVALLNNDMRVDPSWLIELVRTRRDLDARCVGGLILSWDGATIDFAGGAANFHGFGDQPGHGRPTADAPTSPSGDELFACGGSMLVDRNLFDEVGGFDPTYFAYFEDVDFGWRLNVLGERVAFTPHSRVFHRHHGTSGRFAPYQRTLLLERNALRSLVKNVEDEALGKLLSAALLLNVRRSLDESTSDRRRFEPFRRARGSDPVPSSALARLHAIGDIVEELPQLMERRASVQSRRRVPDHTVFERFGRTLVPIGATSPAYGRHFADVVRAMGIDELIGLQLDRAAESLVPHAIPRTGWKERVRGRHRHGPLAGAFRRLNRR